MKILKSKLLQGTLILTIAGIIVRIIGFVYKIYLADIMGAMLLGIYQLIFPIYGLCFTVYGAGIQTAISHMIASMRPHAKKILFFGTMLSFSLSVVLAFVLYFKADWIAEYYLLEKSSAPFLRILPFLFPFCSISACLNGYYYGIQDAKVPAITQIAEQCFRVAFVFAACTFFGKDKYICSIIATWGLVAGEIGGFIYICSALMFHSRKKLRRNKTDKKQNRKKEKHKKTRHPVLKSLIVLSLTLTGSKLVISVLHSIEAVFIPAALRTYGYSGEEALHTYGVLSGMAMPFILFPSAITNAFAIMLLPTISKYHAEKQTKKIKSSVHLTVKYSLILGIMCTIGFFFFGQIIGNIFFHDEMAGIFIMLLSFLCPFQYLSTTLTSIINGLGKTSMTFIITVSGMLLKLYFLIALVPKQGIQAYLIGLLLSQVIVTVWEWKYLKRITN